jgi:cell division septation protein DedD
LLALGALILVSPKANAQPLEDKVIVDMPYTTIIGDKTLAPGEYTIRRLPNSPNSRVLMFFSDGGTKFETSAIAHAVYDPTLNPSSKIVLSRIGDDYYYDKVWVQGKAYGYEFVLPKEVRARMTELSRVTVPASGSMSVITTASTTTTTPVVEESTTVAQEVTQPEVRTEPQTEIAQAAPPAVVEPEPTPAPVASADRSMDEQAPTTTESRESMPSTATAWMAMMLGGFTLLGAGMMVSRKA